MIKTRKLEIGGKNFSAVEIGTPHGTILLIRGSKSILGCGYFSIETANRLGDRFALVTGVRNWDDMLSASVKDASSPALEAGVHPGSSTGREALLLMENS